VRGAANAVGLAGVSVGLDISSMGVLELCFVKGDSGCLTGSGVDREATEVGSLTPISAGFVGVGEAEIVLAGGCSDLTGVTLWALFPPGCGFTMWTLDSDAAWY